MILVVGLGNPGADYDATPHNLGFHCVDLLARRFGAPDFTYEKRFHAMATTARLGRKKILFAKPQTMMNRSGDAVGTLARFYRVPTETIWILHDDLDLVPGTFRHSFDSRAAGHRGVQSIIDALGSQRFHRIRIGVGRHDRLAPDVFVLRTMRKTLSHETDRALASVVDELPSLLSEISSHHEVEKGARHHQPPRRSMEK